MDYRNDLEAAHHRIAALEARVEELEGDGARIGLERQVAALSARLADMGRISRWRALAGAAVPCALALVACGAAMSDADRPAWFAAQLAVVGGFLGSAWAWGHARALWPFLGAAAVKAALFLSWGEGWWALHYRDLDRQADSALGRWDPSLYFFWWAPLLAIALAAAEGLLARRWLAGRAGRA